MRKTLLLFIVATFYACNENRERSRDRNTEIFSFLLKNAFQDSIPQTAHTYILIPDAGCHACREDGLALLHEEIVRSKKDNITYIISPKVHCPVELVQPARLLTDTSGLIDQVDLPISNIAFLKTENGKVVSIESMRMDTKDSIRDYLLR